MILKLHSRSPEQSLEIGKIIGSCLIGDEIILLFGELGSGKTLVTKGVAIPMGINPDDVVSPTFTIMNQFHVKRDNRSFKLFHVDCYRLGLLMEDRKKTGKASDSGDNGHTPSGIILPEVDEYMDEGVIVIEWAQYLHPSYFSLNKVIKTFIHITNTNKRRIRIETRLDYLKRDYFSRYLIAL